MRIVFLIAMVAITVAACEDATKEEPAAVPSAAVDTSPNAEKPKAPVTSVVLDFTQGSAEVQFLSGPSAADRVLDGALQLRPFDGVMSTAGMPAKTGEKYQLQYEVKAVANSTNGIENLFFLGPIGLNAKGEIVQWWQAQTPITIAEGTRKGFSYLEIGPDTTEVRIGMNGNWANPPPAGNGVIGFVRLKLEKLPDE